MPPFVYVQPNEKNHYFILNKPDTAMAKSKYEYVKEFETDDRMLKNVYVLVRIDGKGFHK